MTVSLPKITLFNPIVLPDNRRVTMELVVENLPQLPGFASNVINFYDAPPPSPGPGAGPNSQDDPADKFPNVVLSINNSAGQEVASLLIVEHKEPQTSLTLHLRTPPDQNEQYTARAEMSLKKETIEVVEVPFTLNPMPAADQP